MDLDYIRETIKKEDSLIVICALADEYQRFGYRVCPRNIYQDETARKICVNPCRKRFATCFKKYFKEKKL